MKRKEKVQELRELSVKELDQRVSQAAEELMKLRLRRQTGQLEQSHRLGETRRILALINTIKRQVELGQSAKEGN